MRRETLQYREVVNQFLKVGTTAKLEAFHTFTYCTAAAAGGSSDQLPMAEVEGFSDGDSIFVGLNAAVTISASSITPGDTGAKTVTISSALSFSNNDTIAKDSTASLFDDPDLATSAGAQPLTMDSTTNEEQFFPYAGPHAVRISDSIDGTLRLNHNDAFRELDWATVQQEHAGETAGIGPGVRSLSTAGGTVYLPAGTFSMSLVLTIADNNIRIMGAGRGKTIITQDNSTNLAGGLITLASGVTGFELCHLTIDGNSDNNTTSTANGILLNNNTDCDIHDVDIKNVRSKGIGNASSANPLTRCHVRNVYMTNIGSEGLEFFYAVACKIEDNTIYRCNSHGISVDAGTTQNTDYSRRCRVTGNLVDRSAAASTAQDTFAGNLLHVGGGTELCTFADNILYDNATQGAADSGIGWSHSSGGRAWRQNTFTGNIVSLSDGIGIEIITGSIYSNNVVNQSATHGMRFVGSGAPTSIDRTILATNYIVDANEDAVSATRIHGISIHLHADMKSLSNVIITNNIVANTTGTKLKYALGIVKATGVTGETITGLRVTGNDFEDVDTASVDWYGDATNDVPLADATLTKFRWRDNDTKDVYSDEDTLAAGTVAVTNAAWPAFTNLLFSVTRTDENSSTHVGSLEGKYDDTTTVLDITAYSVSQVQLIDPRDTETWTPDAATALHMISENTTRVMNAPGALTVDRVLVRLGDTDGGGTGDISIEDSEGTPNILVTPLGITSTSDNSWVELLGAGVAAVSDSAINARLTVTGGTFTVNVDYVIVVWNVTPLASADTSKVWWEFIGTKD